MKRDLNWILKDAFVYEKRSAECKQAEQSVSNYSVGITQNGGR